MSLARYAIFRYVSQPNCQWISPRGIMKKTIAILPSLHSAERPASASVVIWTMATSVSSTRAPMRRSISSSRRPMRRTLVKATSTHPSRLLSSSDFTMERRALLPTSPIARMENGFLSMLQSTRRRSVVGTGM